MPHVSVKNIQLQRVDQMPASKFRQKATRSKWTW